MRLGASEPRRGSKRVIIGFLLASIVVLIIGPRIKPVAGVLSPVFTPVQTFVSVIADDIAGFFSNLTNLPHLSHENSDLRKQNAVLKQEEAMYLVQKRRDFAFARMLGFRQMNPDLTYQAAYTTGYSLLGFSPSVTISKGSNSGVHDGDPVVDSYGFAVGHVTGVTPGQSTVGLFVGGNDPIPAMDANTGARGTAGTSSEGIPSFANYNIHKPVHVGDLIVTSSLDNEFPAGIYIGRVSYVEPSKYQAVPVARIQTESDLNNLNYVQVITNFPSRARVDYPKKTAKLGGKR